MKTMLICLACLCLAGQIGLAAPQPAMDKNPVAPVILSAIPSATRIVATSWGYKVETLAGTRNVYKTSLGYRVDGAAGTDNLQIIKTSTGYRIESSAVRGAAFGGSR